MARIIRESTIFTLLIVFLLFMVVNFDPTMATVFILMIIADWLIFKEESIVSFPFESNTKNRFKSLIEALIVFAGFIFLQSVLLRLLTPSIQSTTQSIQTLLSLYSTTTPALQGNILLTFIGFGIIVPFVETRFFNSRLYELLYDFLKNKKTPLDNFGAGLGLKKGGKGLRNINNWIISATIGVVFAIYHLTARRCGSAATCQNALLFVTFIFGMLSTLMVAHYGESKQAVLLHVFANSLAIAFSLGLVGF